MPKLTLYGTVETLDECESDPDIDPQSSLWYYHASDDYRKYLAEAMFEGVCIPPKPPPNHRRWWPHFESKLVISRTPEYRPPEPEPEPPPPPPPPHTPRQSIWQKDPYSRYIPNARKCGDSTVATSKKVRIALRPRYLFDQIVEGILRSGFQKVSTGTYRKEKRQIETCNNLYDQHTIWVKVTRCKNFAVDSIPPSVRKPA